MRGSSPLARGTLWNGIKGIIDGGLIPARAGNTEIENVFSLDLGAHPRSRGEHHGATPENIDAVGSSPLARGTPANAVTGNGLTGLIPARAGNTSTSE